MATLIDSPTSPQTLDGCLRWKIGKGSGGDIVRIGYKLMQGSDEIIGLSASDLDEFEGNFIKDCRGLVQTSIPIPNPGIANETRFSKEFKLVYGDIIIDDCEATVSVNNDSSEIEVLNAYSGIHDLPDILTARPSRYEVGRYSEDYLWVYGNASVSYTWRNKDGTTGTLNVSAPFDVNIVPMTPVAINYTTSLPGSFDITQVSLWDVVITIGATSKTYTVQFADCFEIDLMWLEPLGSYSCLSFENFTAQTYGSRNVVDISSICKQTQAPSIGTTSTEFHRKKEVIGIDGGIEFTMQRRVTAAYSDYLSELSKNRGAYIFYQGKRVFIDVDPGGIQTHRTKDFIDVTVTGRI